MKKSIILLVLMTLIGCSNHVSEGNLRRATARSIGLQEHEFIIGNRENNNTSIKYDVKTTKEGYIYHCTTTFAPIKGGVITRPVCVDDKGVTIQPETTEVTF